MEPNNISLDPSLLSRANRIFGRIALFAGLAFLLGGGYVIHRWHLDQFMFESETADGVVVENRAQEVNPQPGSSDLPYTSYQAIVRFKDRRGQILTYADWFGFGRASFHMGQTVRVLYDPRNPQHAMIDRGDKNYIVPGIVLFFGVCLVAGGLQRLAMTGPPPVLASSPITIQLGRR